jgi:hypothetical protein
MQLTAHLPLKRARVRGIRSDRAVRLREPARPAPTVAHDRAKRSGGPADTALYSCSCGFAFQAEVTTSVGCPHCGTSQAW